MDKPSPSVRCRIIVTTEVRQCFVVDRDGLTVAVYRTVSVQEVRD